MTILSDNIFQSVVVHEFIHLNGGQPHLPEGTLANAPVDAVTLLRATGLVAGHSRVSSLTIHRREVIFCVLQHILAETDGIIQLLLCQIDLGNSKIKS